MILNRNIGEEEAAVLVDAAVDEGVLSNDRVNRIDRDRNDAIVESVLGADRVDNAVAVLDAGFPLFGGDTEPEIDEGFSVCHRLMIGSLIGSWN